MANANPSRHPLNTDQFQFVRFLAVGVVNTAFSYGAYSFFLFIGLHYAAASLFALILGILWSYQTTGRVVFQNQLRNRLPRYVLVWAVLYGVNVGIIALFTAMGFGPYLAGLIGLVPVTIFGFLMQKHYVFAHPKGPPGTPGSDQAPPE